VNGGTLIKVLITSCRCLSITVQNYAHQMVGSQNGPISGEVVKVVHDDSDEQVQDEERADDKKGDEIRIGKVGTAASGIICILAVLITQDV